MYDEELLALRQLSSRSFCHVYSVFNFHRYDYNGKTETANYILAQGGARVHAICLWSMLNFG